MYSNVASSRTAGTNARRKSTAVSPVKPLAILSVIIPIFVAVVYIVHASRTSFASEPPESVLGPISRESVFQVNTTGAIDPARTAYVTTLTHGRKDSYARFLAIRVLLESLKKSQSGIGRDVIVLVSDHVPADYVAKLRGHGAKIIQMPKSVPGSASLRADADGALSLPRGHLSDVDPITSGRVTPVSSTTNSLSSFGFAAGGLVGVGPCHSEFASVHAWGLHSQYERVVMLEPHVLPILKLDELFLCGEFCMIYSSLTWFQTSVLTIKPSEYQHRLLLERITEQVTVDASVHSSPSDSGCQAAFEDFLLQAFPSIEKSPLFTPTVGQQNYPVMRLSSGYSVNPLYWYEKYNWNLARVKEYTNMTGTTVFQIPAHAVAWPRHKPWYWFPAIYFNVHWVWAHHRSVILGESFFFFNTIALLAIAAGIFISGAPIDKAMMSLLNITKEALPPLVGANAVRSTLFTFSSLFNFGGKEKQNINSGTNNPSNNDYNASNPYANVHHGHLMSSTTASSKVHQLPYRLSVALGRIVSLTGWNIPGLVIGIPFAVLSGFIVYALIPYHIMYYYAWPVFILGLSALHLLFLRMFALLIILPIVGTAAWSSVIPPPLSQSPPSSNTLLSSSSILRRISSLWSSLYPSDGGRSVSTLLSLLSETGTLSPTSLAYSARTIASPSSLRFPVLFMLGSLALLHGDIYAHFVLKIIIMYSMVGISCVLLAIPFVQLLRVHHFSKAGLGRW